MAFSASTSKTNTNRMWFCTDFAIRRKSTKQSMTKNQKPKESKRWKRIKCRETLNCMWEKNSERKIAFCLLILAPPANIYHYNRNENTLDRYNNSISTNDKLNTKWIGKHKVISNNSSWKNLDAIYFLLLSV